MSNARRKKMPSRSRLGSESKVQKGAILVMLGRKARALAVLEGKNVFRRQQPAREVYDGAVFEIKKEIRRNRFRILLSHGENPAWIFVDTTSD